MTRNAPNTAILADHIHGLPAGRPAVITPQKAFKCVCDGCGKTKPCITYKVANVQSTISLDLCPKCRKWYLEKVTE